MSVVEFSADSWQASSPGLQKSLADRSEALEALLQGLQSLAASGNISGQGADAMRAYIREVHVPIVQSLLVCLSTFQTAIGVYWNGYSQVDTDGNFRLVNDEFDAHRVQLDTGIEQLRGFAASLRSIAASASHLVSLDGAGAGAADAAAEGFERMRSIVTSQQETWAAYEATDPGFGQVKNLVAELNRVVGNLGSLTVGQGRSYVSGSFNLTLRTLGELTGGMLEYCRTNQQVASDGWQALFSGYVDDVKAEAERQRKEDALSGLLWDGLQTAAGAVIAAVGVAGTPFSAGMSLTLAGLGGSLIAGGVNSAIDHASIASTGESLNLVGMASQGIGQWYDVTLAQPAIASGDPDLQLLAGAVSGLGDQISGALQLNIHDVANGVFTLATNGEAFSQVWNQLTTTAGKAASGDAFVIGQIAGNLIPLGALTKVTKLNNVINKADDLGGLVTKADDLGFGKHVTIAAASDTTSAMDWLKNHLGAGGVTVSDEFTPTIRPTDGIDGSTVKSDSVVVANTTDTVKHALTATRDDLLNALGNAEKKLGEVGQNLHSAPELAGGGTLPPGTPLTDALTHLFRNTDTPATPRTNFGGGSGGDPGAVPASGVHDGMFENPAVQTFAERLSDGVDRADIPGYDPTGGLGWYQFLDRYLDGFDASGRPRWRWPADPPHTNGFTDGLSQPADLVSGDVIERITFVNKDGLPLDGNFAAPPGTPFDQLSLPPDRLSGSTIKLNYRVLRPLPDGVQMGEIAPGFEQRGGGTQYHFPGGLERLVELGYLEEIK